jgi:hypothetical protein
VPSATAASTHANPNTVVRSLRRAHARELQPVVGSGGGLARRKAGDRRFFTLGVSRPQCYWCQMACLGDTMQEGLLGRTFGRVEPPQGEGGRGIGIGREGCAGVNLRNVVATEQTARCGMRQRELHRFVYSLLSLTLGADPVQLDVTPHRIRNCVIIRYHGGIALDQSERARPIVGYVNFSAKPDQFLSPIYPNYPNMFRRRCSRQAQKLTV